MTIQEMKEARAKLIADARAIADKVEGEKRAPTQEEIDTGGRMIDEAIALKGQIDQRERLEAQERELRESARPEFRATVGGDAAKFSAPTDSAAVEAEARAFSAWVRRGFSGISDEDRAIMQARAATLTPEERALSSVTSGSGGAFVPQGFMDKFDRAQKSIGGVYHPKLNVEFIDTSAGNPLPYPTLTDGANSAAILGENTAATDATDPTFGAVTLGAYNYATTVLRVPIQLLDDSAFDVEAMIASVLGERIARGFNAGATTGTGTSQPQGMVTAATTGKTGTAGQTTSLIYDDLVDLVFSVDPMYRTNAVFQMNDSTLALVAKIKDSQNKPLWMSGLATTDSITILQRVFPVVINQAMAVPAASAKPVLFGDFSRYKVRRVKGVRLLRLVERYADSLQVGFIAFQRLDGRSVDASGAAFKCFANPAS